MMNGYTEVEACVKPVPSCRERGRASCEGASSLDERLVYSRSVLLVIFTSMQESLVSASSNEAPMNAWEVSFYVIAHKRSSMS